MGTRSGSVVDVPLFAGYEPPPPAPELDDSLSPQRRLTIRQAAAISVGRHPLTGGPLHELASRHRDASSPKNDPYTCGSCYFRTVVGYHGRSYPKCLYDPRRGADDPLDHYARVAHSAASDVRSWWPACPAYSPGDRLADDAARCIPEQAGGAAG